MTADMKTLLKAQYIKGDQLDHVASMLLAVTSLYLQQPVCVVSEKAQKKAKKKTLTKTKQTKQEEINMQAKL